MEGSVQDSVMSKARRDVVILHIKGLTHNTDHLSDSRVGQQIKGTAVTCGVL